MAKDFDTMDLKVKFCITKAANHRRRLLTQDGKTNYKKL